eukprot:TRINITY_DN251_c3_g1_i1.p1 TRINITY_DN251_c3_g1~~TRINITY_DN251_c3_g1_i1.p1  ORF type:complete len:349 (+),score=83.55 TRINITY_DN251_c3_g1_i1:80-1048(+)
MPSVSQPWRSHSDVCQDGAAEWREKDGPHRCDSGTRARHARGGRDCKPRRQVARIRTVMASAAPPQAHDHAQLPRARPVMCGPGVAVAVLEATPVVSLPVHVAVPVAQPTPPPPPPADDLLGAIAALRNIDRPAALTELRAAVAFPQRPATRGPSLFVRATRPIRTREDVTIAEGSVGSIDESGAVLFCLGEGRVHVVDQVNDALAPFGADVHGLVGALLVGESEYTELEAEIAELTRKVDEVQRLKAAVAAREDCAAAASAGPFGCSIADQVAENGRLCGDVRVLQDQLSDAAARAAESAEDLHVLELAYEVLRADVLRSS